MATRSPTPRWLVRCGGVDCFCRTDFGPTVNPGRYGAEKCFGITHRTQPSLADRLLQNSKPPTAVSGASAPSSTTSPNTTAITVTLTSRSIDALHCRQPAVTEAQRLLGLDDPRADRDVMDILDANATVIGQAQPRSRWSPTTAPAFADLSNRLRHGSPRRPNPQTGLPQPTQPANFLTQDRTGPTGSELSTVRRRVRP